MRGHHSSGRAATPTTTRTEERRGSRGDRRGHARGGSGGGNRCRTGAGRSGWGCRDEKAAARGGDELLIAGLQPQGLGADRRRHRRIEAEILSGRENRIDDRAAGERPQPAAAPRSFEPAARAEKCLQSGLRGEGLARCSPNPSLRWLRAYQSRRDRTSTLSSSVTSTIQMNLHPRVPAVKDIKSA